MLSLGCSSTAAPDAPAVDASPAAQAGHTVSRSVRVVGGEGPLLVGWRPVESGSRTGEMIARVGHARVLDGPGTVELELPAARDVWVIAWAPDGAVSVESDYPSRYGAALAEVGAAGPLEIRVAPPLRALPTWSCPGERVHAPSGREACQMTIGAGEERATVVLLPGAAPAYLGRLSFPRGELTELARARGMEITLVLVDTEDLVASPRSDAAHAAFVRDVEVFAGAREGLSILAGRSSGATLALEVLAALPDTFDRVALDAPFGTQPLAWRAAGPGPCTLAYPWAGWLRAAAAFDRGMVLTAVDPAAPLTTDTERCESIASASRAVDEHGAALAAFASRGGRVALRCGRADELGVFPDCVKLAAAVPAAQLASRFHDGGHDETRAGWGELWRAALEP